MHRARVIPGAIFFLAAFLSAAFPADDSDELERNRHTTPDKLPADFGPLRQADFVIVPPASFVPLQVDNSPYIDEDKPIALVIGASYKANAWSVLIFFWPEIALIFILLVLLFLAWRAVRIVRKPQAVGEPICRRCGYQLTGATGEACPECGAKLTPRTRIVGRSRGRRLLVPGIIAGLFAVAGGVLFYLWYPPDFSDGYWCDDDEDLSRLGSVNGWFYWPSESLYRWAGETVEMDVVPYYKLYVVRLDGRGYEPVRHEAQIRHAQRQNTSLFDEPDAPLQFVRWDWRSMVILNGESAFTFDLDAETIREKPALIEKDPGPSDELHWSADRQYMFRTIEAPLIEAWDTATWKPTVFPSTTWKQGEELHEIDPLWHGSWAIVRVGIGSAWDNRTNSTVRAVAWNPQTNEVFQVNVPEDGVPIALSRDERHVLFENEHISDGNFHDASHWPYVVTLNDAGAPREMPSDKMGRDQNDSLPEVRIAALSKTADTAYVFAYEKTMNWYAWNFVTNEVTRMKEPRGDQVEHWFHPPHDLRNPKLTGDFDGQLHIVRDIDHARVDTLPTPAESSQEFQTAFRWFPSREEYVKTSRDGRFVIARATTLAPVVFDRKTRRWIGRLDITAHVTDPDWISASIISANRWLVIVVHDTPVKFLVFDLLKE